MRPFIAATLCLSLGISSTSHAFHLPVNPGLCNAAFVPVHVPDSDVTTEKMDAAQQILSELATDLPAEGRELIEGLRTRLDMAVADDLADGIVTRESLIADVAVAVEPMVANALVEHGMSLPERLLRSFKLRPICFAIGAVTINVLLLSMAPAGAPRDALLLVAGGIVSSYVGLALAGFNSIMIQLAAPNAVTRGKQHLWIKRFVDIAWSRRRAYDDFVFDGANQSNFNTAFTAGELVAPLLTKDFDLATKQIAFAAKSYKRNRAHMAPDDELIAPMAKANLEERFGNQASADAIMKHIMKIDIDAETQEGLAYYQLLIYSWTGFRPVF